MRIESVRKKACSLYYPRKTSVNLAVCFTDVPLAGTDSSFDCRRAHGGSTRRPPHREAAHYTIATYCRTAGTRCRPCRGIASCFAIDTSVPDGPETSRCICWLRCTIASYCHTAGTRRHRGQGIAMHCAVESNDPGVPDTTRHGRL